ncbi:MAG TPA: signal recognition particle-docking protein FtsY [Actinomycetaceae bacterium]|nr:signal recognition particle-docking protein FtsY [Actinomycetaceae bacterium]
MATEILILIIAVGVLVVAGVLFVGVRSRSRKNARLSEREASPYPGDLGADSGGVATLERPETDEDPTDEAPPADAPALAVPTLERPEAAATRWQRLRARLVRSGAIGNAILAILSRGKLSESDWEEIEETLLMADLGLDPTTRLMDKLRAEAKVLDTSDPAAVREVLRRELLVLVDPDMDRTLDVSPVVGDDGEAHPATILVVGVNGTGKTTTVGKLARVLVAEGHDVLLGAADTFRAAAADQLETWGSRVGVPVVRSDREGADPASVAFETVKVGVESGADVVIVDTAGRLQTKADLMDELGKIKRVMGRGAPVREVLLVLDATTGQNGMRQAQVFSEAVDVTGIVLTKLDGTAKGGIVVAVQEQLGVPVKFVGLGEGADDLAPFDPDGFVDALIS